MENGTLVRQELVEHWITLESGLRDSRASAEANGFLAKFRLHLSGFGAGCIGFAMLFTVGTVWWFVIGIAVWAYGAIVVGFLMVGTAVTVYWENVLERSVIISPQNTTWYEVRLRFLKDAIVQELADDHEIQPDAELCVNENGDSVSIAIIVRRPQVELIASLFVGSPSRLSRETDDGQQSYGSYDDMVSSWLLEVTADLPLVVDFSYSFQDGEHQESDQTVESQKGPSGRL